MHKLDKGDFSLVAVMPGHRYRLLMAINNFVPLLQEPEYACFNQAVGGLGGSG